MSLRLRDVPLILQKTPRALPALLTLVILSSSSATATVARLLTMAMGGQGPMAVLVMWIMVVPTLLCVVLRFYTRVFVIQSHGADDHVYNLAFVSPGVVFSTPSILCLVSLLTMLTPSLPADLLALLHHLHNYRRRVWLWTERIGAGTKQSLQCDPFRGYRADICSHRDGGCKVVSGAFPAAHHPPEGTQDPDLDCHGFAYGGERINLFRILAAVHATQVSLGPQHPRRILPG